MIITAAVLLFRFLGHGPERTGATIAVAARKPEQVLAERFARGEINEEEYQRRLAVLVASPPDLNKN